MRCFPWFGLRPCLLQINFTGAEFKWFAGKHGFLRCRGYVSAALAEPVSASIANGLLLVGIGAASRRNGPATSVVDVRKRTIGADGCAREQGDVRVVL
jgi:hypothetical protein